MRGKLPSEIEINQSEEILKNGGVIVYPTDTVFGVGCVFDNKAGLDRIYSLKSRPKSQPMPLLISNYDQLKKLDISLAQVAKQLAIKYWPGALTLILKTKANKKIGIRIPNYPPVISLIDAVGKPIVGTSANFHNDPPAKKMDELNKNFISQIDYLMKGECLLGLESTVVDCAVTPIKVVRNGAVKLWRLFIDTSEADRIEVSLLNFDRPIDSKVEQNKSGSQVLLPLINKILKLNHLKLQDLYTVEVKTGPGSFTGLRVGISVANALGYSLKISVNDKNVGQLVYPTY